MRILLISDNHGIIEDMQEVLANERYDVAIHLGDAEVEEEWMQKNFTYYVAGNHDNFDVKEAVVELEGLRIGFCHGNTLGISIYNYEQALEEFAHKTGANIVLFGHLHAYKNYEINGIRYICPGSIFLSRGPEGSGYCLLDIVDGQIINSEFRGISQ